MKITINDALRLKNEISRIVDTFNSTRSGRGYGLSNSSTSTNIKFGVEKIDGVPTKEENKVHVDEYLYAFTALLDFAQEINDSIANANVQNKVSSFVRRMSNIDTLLRAYENALSLSSPWKETRKEIRKEVGGDKIVDVEYSFEPFMPKSDIKIQMKELKKEKRELQQAVEKADIQEIELSFEYNDIEELSMLLS